MTALPKRLEIDLENRLGYIRYSDDDSVKTLDIWQDGAVAADVGVNDAVIGIELLSLDDETIQHAREFAHSRGIGFPRDLSGIFDAA